jgi:Protein of unknown function (DUF3352)
MSRRFLLPLLALLAVLAAGCGGSTSTSASSTSAGASVAPASASIFITIDTDPGSAQWKQADTLLSKFPARPKLIDAINRELAKQGVDYEQDIKPALGDELDVAVLGLEEGSRDVVGMLQPKDKAKFQALIDKIDKSDPSSPKAVTAEYKGWTLVSDKQTAIDTFRSEADKGSLADDATYKEATAKEPGDSLVSAYVNGAALQQLLQRLGSQLGGAAGCNGAQATGSTKLRYVSGALSAESNGVRLHGSIVSENASSAGGGGTKALLSEIPSGALLVLAFHGTDQFTQGFQQLQQSCGDQVQKSFGQIEALLGVKLKDLAALFKNETALYVRAGSPIPEVTLLSHQDDPQAALATIDTLAKRLGGLLGGEPHDTTLEGTPAKELVVGGRVSIFYAALGSEVVVTDSRTGFHDLKSGGSKLKDDPAFTDAQKASGLGDDESAFLYVDLKDAIPLIESLVQLAGTSIPPEVDANLQPLKSFVIYGSGTNGRTEFTAFLELQ